MGIIVPEELMSSTPKTGISSVESGSDDAAIMERAEQNLAKVYGDTPDDDVVESDPEETEDTEEKTDSPTDSETPVEEEEPESGDDDEGAESSEAEEEGSSDDPSDEGGDTDESESSTLPAAWRRSAKARGWSDEEIDAYWKANPELASSVLERMHTSRVAETNEWARLGRAARDQEQSPPVEPVKSAAPVVPSAGSLPLVDKEKLVEQYGNEELVEAIAGPVNEVIRRMNEVLPVINQGVEAVQQAQSANLSRHIEEFFRSEEMKPYRDAFGESFDSLTQEQQDRRFTLLEMADALMYGAREQHRRLSIDDALLQARDASASDLQEKAIRTRISKSVKTRSRGRTLRSSQRGKKPEEDGPPKDRAELVARTDRRLNALKDW